MAKKKSECASTQFGLVVRDKSGQRLTSTGSPRNLDGTREFAQEIMRLMPEAAFVDIYAWSAGLKLSEAEPQETVHRSGEKP